MCAELALQAEPLIAAKAKERQSTRNDLNIPANLPESKETRDELSAMSGVSARSGVQWWLVGWLICSKAVIEKVKISIPKFRF